MATTTDAYGHGGLALAGSATTTFVHGNQVDSDIVFEWDLDGDGDFDADVEDVTAYVYDAESFTGRDWPSQLRGKAGPGQLRLRLRNDDDRFSYFNADSPLNQDGRSLDPGRRIRVRISGATDIDPVLLARDRFDGDGAVTTDELGNAWQHQTPYVFTRVSGQATAPTSGQQSEMLIDTGETDYYAQVTISEMGDNVTASAGLQENNEVRLIYRWQDDANYSYLSMVTFNGSNVLVYEAFDVVAGAASSTYGPHSTVGSTGIDDSEGDHRRRITIGVYVAGSVAHFYLNGARVTTTNETAFQLDETRVGLYASYGVGNRAPAFDEFAVWDRIPADTEGVLWTGYVIDVLPEAAPGAPKTVTVTAEGVLAQLAGSTIQPGAWAGSQKTGVAIGDAVERAGLLYPPGVLAVGAFNAGSSSDAEIGALTHCRKLEEVEFGFLHEAPEGWLIFRDRTYRDALTTTATFSDAEGAQFSYQEFDLLNWRREIVNKVTCGVSYGTPDLVVVGGGTNTSAATGVNRPINFTVPALNDGDLFVVMITSTIDSNSENWLVPIFWVRERDTGASVSRRTQVYTHIGAASENGSTVTFYNDTGNAGGSYILRYYQLRNWYGTHEGIAIGPWAVGTGFAGADPEPILPPWGDTNPTAFIAQRCGTRLAGAGAVANPTYPLGYVNGFSVFQNGTSGDDDDCGMQLSSKLAMASIEDPATFTGFTNLQNAETSVIAVRGRNGSPPEPRGRLRVTVEDVDSQRMHGTVASYDACDLFRTEDDAETWCELMLTRYARVRPVVRITFTATLSGAYRAQAYKRRLGDKVRVVATQGTGMGIDADFHVESIKHSWTDAGKLWVTTWELSPAG
jgi:hypothetical protein